MTPKLIRKLRQEKKISLLELAALTGLPSEYISKIEDESITALKGDLVRLYDAILRAAAEHVKDADEDEEDKNLGIDRYLHEG